MWGSYASDKLVGEHFQYRWFQAKLFGARIRACAERHPSGMLVSKPGDHQLAHRQIDERLTTGVGALKIA